MITCRMLGNTVSDELENFHNGNWSFEFLDRDSEELPHPISRFRCKDNKNNFRFYYLEFTNSNDKRIFAFKDNEQRTLFLLTWFLK